MLVGGVVGWMIFLSLEHDEVSYNKLFYILLGIDGAVLGGWLMCFLGSGDVSGYNSYHMFAAVLGSFTLVHLMKFLRVLK